MSGKNDFMDRIFNCDYSSNKENDWIFEDAIAADLFQLEASIPGSVDLRVSWWKIGDQKSTGSCVGWASADSVIRWHFVKAGRLDQKEKLSPRHVWMASKETDEFTFRPTSFIESSGTSLKAALDIARKFGCVPEQVLPFEPALLYAGRPNAFYAIATRYKIAGYLSLGTDPDGWRNWLATSGPILTRLNVDDTFLRAAQNDGKLEDYHSNNTVGGHAIAMVGYTDEHFIIRNSWGTDWGDEGFGYASNGYASAAFDEAYGIFI